MVFQPCLTRPMSFVCPCCEGKRVWPPSSMDGREGTITVKEAKYGSE